MKYILITILIIQCFISFTYTRRISKFAEVFEKLENSHQNKNYLSSNLQQANQNDKNIKKMKINSISKLLKQSCPPFLRSCTYQIV